ncbi:MAG: hypothetical protein IKL29_10280, partial [Bacteroidaceae bacterium]|nr:hypothetical protein [Bacteroidaceae bacterium]
MTKLLKLATSLLLTLMVSTTGVFANAPQSDNKDAKDGFDRGKKLLDRSIKRDKPYDIDTTRVYGESVIDAIDGKDAFTFSEGQLDEDEDVIQGASTMSTSSDDYFLSEVGYLFSPMRFRIRAYENMYNNVYANGVLLNDAERGNFSYGMIGGLNDATRNREGSTYL